MHMQAPNVANWNAAMIEELKAIEINQTWELVEISGNTTMETHMTTIVKYI